MMGVNAAITLLIALLNNAAQISALLQKAQSEGRDSLTTDEWDSITRSDDIAREQLVAAIAKAKEEGR